MHADCPLKKASQLYHSCGKAGHLKANCPNPIYNNCREVSYFKNNCLCVMYN